MKLTFIGAAQTVTGSMHLLEVNNKKILFDCGLYQGKRKEAFEINRTFDIFDPKEIDFVILSHAHIDHAGNLPNLVKRGYNGPIFSTFATRDLSSLMLLDSAHIQQKDVEFVNKRRRKQGKNLFEPLYSEEDVYETNGNFIAVNYRKEFNITPEIELTFYDAGHILGSAISFLKIKEKGRIINFAFSGDIGRPGLPILKDPQKIPDVDFFICESTYGGRFHDDPIETEAKLISVIQKAIDRKGKIIIPAFSVGRTQEVVYELNKIFSANKVQEIPVYVDSPLSSNATEIFRLHPECFDMETSKFMIKHPDPFGFNKLKYIRDVEDSKALNNKPGPCIIISASGMAEAGRVLHHLYNNIEDENNIILMVGFCAQHTLGRKIIEREPVVKVFGEEKNVRAEVIVMNSLSAHADADELIDYCGSLDKGRMQNIFLVHGDIDQQEKFKERLHSADFQTVTIPSRGESFEL